MYKRQYIIILLLLIANVLPSALPPIVKDATTAATVRLVMNTFVFRLLAIIIEILAPVSYTHLQQQLWNVI